MPIEIKELVVKATVQPQNESSSSSSASESMQSMKEQIIQDCLEKVAQMIKERNER